MGNYFSVEKSGNIRSYSGYFSNSTNSNYINLSGNNLLFNIDGKLIVPGETLTIQIPFYINHYIKLNRRSVHDDPTQQLLAKLYGSSDTYQNVQIQYMYIKPEINEIYKMTNSYDTYRLVLTNQSSENIFFDLYVEAEQSDLFSR